MDDDLQDLLVGEIPSMHSEDGELTILDIESRQQATRMLRLYRQTELAADQIKAEAEAEIAPIKAWRDDRLSGVNRRLDWLRTGLRQWMLSERARSGDTIKSISLPTGTVKTRAPQKRVAVVGELSHDHAVKFPPIMERIEYVLDKPSAARVFEQGEPIGYDGNDRVYQALYNGEIVPNVVFLIGLDPTFSIVPLDAEGRTDDE